MIQSVLFTKEIDKEWLRGQLGNEILIDTRPTLQFEYSPRENIIQQVNADCKQYIITSQNSVKAIQSLSLDGHFFVVGKKTAQKIRELNFKVEIETDYAEELAYQILHGNFDYNWNFFCGNTRRNLLVDELTKYNNNVNEIITYQSFPIEYKVENEYDAYVFFSPLSFQTFMKMNSIPKNSTIFTVGNTTTSEVKTTYPSHKIITATVPLLDVVVNNIKHCINDKK